MDASHMPKVPKVGGSSLKAALRGLTTSGGKSIITTKSNTRGGGGVERVCVASTIRDIQHEIKLEQRLRQDISNKNDGENTR